MTNLLATLLITVSTNWTGSGDPARECGTIVTNYEAQCVFDGKTNVFLLDKRYADTVAWRKASSSVQFLTNSSFYGTPSLIFSNPYPQYWFNR